MPGKSTGWLTIVFYVLIVALLIPYGIILGADLSIRTGFSNIENDNWFEKMQIGMGVCFLALFSLFCLVERIARRAQPATRRTLRWIGVIFLSIGLIFLLNDEPERQFPYTWQDVPIVSTDNLQSYDLIVDHMKGPTPKINIENSGDILKVALDAPLTHEDDIMEVWKSVQSGRDLIDVLYRFEQIADLAMPENAIDISIMQIEFLARIYRAYALLMAEKGDWQQGIAQLGKIHAVAIKALPYARYLINKIIWTAVVERNIKIALRLAQHPRADRESLRQLAQAFPPLDDLAASFRGALISETMFMLESAKSTDTLDDLRSEICASYLYENLCGNWWHTKVLQALLLTCYKPQATENLIKTHMIPLIHACSRTPPQLAEDNPVWPEAARPVFGNTMGWLFINYSMGDFGHYPRRLAETKVMSDLLSLYLESRMGEKENGKDFLCKDVYLSTDEPGIFKSAGWDCIAGTEDDIVLNGSE